jgi:hypothetical protein
MQKTQIPEMGSHQDRRRREDTRIDSDRRRFDIEMTRGWIFERGYPVAGSKVEAILKPSSGVPTRVSCFSPIYLSHQLTYILECFLATIIQVWIQLFFNVRSRPFARV